MKSPANPYVGPRAFLESELLYGRDREVADLRDMLLAERIVLLYSPSGAGKSSLLQARLIPVMRDRGFTVRKVIRVNAAPPDNTGNRYVISMMTSLQLEGRPADFEKLTLNQYLDAEPNGELLVFDQFEEVLTTDAVNIQAKRDFFEQVGHALRARGRWALFAMREDFLAALDPYLNYIPTRLSNTFRLGLLSYEASLKAIREPAARVGVKFLDDAVQQIADDLRQVNVPQPDGSVALQLGQFIEPVQLQVVCLRRWEDLAEGSQEITKSAQAQIGSTALSDYYAATVAQVAADSGTTERTIRDWFEHSLITRIQTRGQVLMGSTETDGLSNNAVIKPLEQAHLINSELRLGSRWLELAHDRLIHPVRSSNEVWNTKNLNPLQREAELWNDQGRPADRLFGKDSLPAAEDWARSNKLNSTEEDFLKESRAAAQQKLADEERRLQDIRTARILKLGVAALLLLLVWVGRETYRAKEATKKAQQETLKAEAGKLLGEALIYKESHQDLAALLGIEGMNKVKEKKDADADEIFRARNTLLLLLQANPFLSTILHHGSRDLYHIVFSPDGKWLASGSGDGTVQLWDVDHRQPIGKPLPAGSVAAMAFSPPDRKLLAIASIEQGLQLWDVDTQQRVGKPLLPSALVKHLAFVGDGELLAAASIGQLVQLWNVDSHQPAGELKAGGVEIAFGSDGRLMASASDDGTIQLWDVAKTQKIGKPLKMNERSAGGKPVDVGTLALSPAGNRLAVGKSDGTVQLWDLPSSQQWGAPLICHSSSVEIITLAFRGDGKRLAVASDDGTLQVWDVEDKDKHRLMVEPLEIYSNAVAFQPEPAGITASHLLVSAGDYGMVQLWEHEHEQPIGKVLTRPAANGHLGAEFLDNPLLVATSPDGKIVAFLDADAVHLWDVATRQQVGTPLPTGSCQHLAFSPPDAKMLAAAHSDTVQLWDVASQQPVGKPLSTGQLINGLAFSPEGKLLATASEDGSIQLWDVASGQQAGEPLPIGNGADASLFFSPDGNILAALQDGVVYMWNVNSRQKLGEPVKGQPGDILEALAFSPDGKLLASAGDEGKIQLLELGSQRTVAELKAKQKEITSLTFSLDGNLLASGGEDGTVQLWDADSRNSLGEPLKGHPDQVTSLAFSPNGKKLVSISGGGMVWQWDTDPDSWERKLCSIANRNFFPDEWTKYMKDKPYRVMCRDLPSGEPAPAK
jgi:WD40 repeat protein